MRVGVRQCAVHVCTVCTSLVFLLMVVLVVRMLTLVPRAPPPPCNPQEGEQYITLDEARLTRFRQILRFQTVSHEIGVQSFEELRKLQLFIKNSYPAVHSSPLVGLEVVSNYSLLYTVRGSDASLRPFLLASHLDVVPESPGDWHAPPFSGDIVGGHIYGRGTIDAKNQLVAILEALEFLLQSGYQPRRSFYLAFGHDEEIGGYQGAYIMGQLLEQRGVQLEFMLDEGLTVTSGIVIGMKTSAALIGTSEKGMTSLQLSVNMTGGHSSMPRKESAIGVLAGAISRLERTPQPIMFGLGPEVGMLEQLAPQMSLLYRLVMTNLWLFGPIVSRIMANSPAPSSMIRTTTAITIFQAGIKENVIPPTATAVVNHRIHPAQTLEQVLEYNRWVINDDRVQMEVLHYWPPLPLSPYTEESFGYQTIKASIRQIWGDEDVAVAPALLTGNTDTKHYTNLTDSIYRFAPNKMVPEDIPRFHGLNERISRENYEKGINFYYHLLLNADKDRLDSLHQHGGEL